MWPNRVWLVSCGIGFIFFIYGCAGNRQATHEGDLIDNKVTAQRIEAELRKAGPAFRHVTVEASASGVTLTGRVKSEDERERAEKVARGVHRDFELHNNLKINE